MLVADMWVSPFKMILKRSRVMSFTMKLISYRFKAYDVAFVTATHYAGQFALPIVLDQRITCAAWLMIKMITEVERVV